MKTVYFSIDTRIAAAQWASNNTDLATQVAAEPYDLGVLPFNEIYSNIVLLPTYDIDQNTSSLKTLQGELAKSNILILLSQRLIYSRVRNRQEFPKGNTFYAELLNGKTPFRKIYQTPCDIFCTITYLGNPLFNTEETVSVFDRPTIMIFQKNNL